MRWYERAMPRICDVLPQIQEATNAIKQNKEVKNIYAWGSVGKNYHNKNYRIKDIDLLVTCSIDAADLLGIGIEEDNSLNMSRDELEDLGYNFQAINFTKIIKKLAEKNFDIWVIAKNDELLHWGVTTDTAKEWEELKQEAEYRTIQQIKLNKRQIQKASASKRKNWLEVFHEHMKNITQEVPVGWYQSNDPINQDTFKTAKLLS